LLFSFAFTVAVVSCVTYAASKTGTCGNGITWTLDSFSLTVSGSGNMTCSLCSVSDLKYISSAKLEDGVLSIGKNVFADCSSLKVVNLSNTVTYIGDSAFSGCTVLRSLEIPASVSVIESNAFSGCTSLNSITVASGNSVFASEDGVLFDKQLTELKKSPANKTSVSIPNTVVSIGDFAFSDSKVEELMIPDSVSSFGCGAFSGCSQLQSFVISGNNNYFVFENGFLMKKDGTVLYFYPHSGASVTIPNSVRTIANYTFYSHAELVSINLSNVESIGSYAFYGCKLADVNIPDSVVSIGQFAFANCAQLNSVIIGRGITSIENFTFSSNKKLHSVRITESVTSIGSRAFDNCDELSLNEYKNGLYLPTETNQYYALYRVCNKSYTDVSVHASAVIIAENSFYSSSVQSVSISDSVKVIGMYAFFASNVDALSLGNGVEIIAPFAFYACRKLKTLVIPDSVTYIGKYAFCNGEVLTNIIFGNNVSFIGQKAFHNCRLIEDVIIPDSVQTIESGAFMYSFGLRTLTIGKGVSSLGDLVFSDTPELRSLIVDPDNSYFKSIDNVLYDKSGKTLIMCAAKQSSVKIESTVTSICDYAFSHCVVEQITIPDSVTSLGNFVFLYSLIKAIHVSEGNTVFKSKNGYLMNKDGSVLLVSPPGKDSAIVPNSVKEIQSKAFESAITTRVMVGDNVVSIGERAFFASSLEEISVGKSVSFIGSEAFSRCKSLAKFCYFGKSDPAGNSSSVFTYVSNLKNVTVPPDYEDSRFCQKSVWKREECSVDVHEDGSDNSYNSESPDNPDKPDKPDEPYETAASLKTKPSNWIIASSAMLMSTMFLSCICRN